MASPEPNSEQDTRTRSSTTGLVGDAFDHVTGLVRGEIDLARAELQENVSKAMTAIGMLVGAVVVVLVALNVLAAALTAALAETGLGAGWAALIVGGVLALIALMMALKGKNDLKLASLAPTRTAKNVRRDAESVREATDGR